MARALIYLYTGIYESDDIVNGLAGEMRQFSLLSDEYSGASEDAYVDCELCVKMYNLADRIMLPELQAELRHIFLRAYYRHRESNNENDKDMTEDPLSEEDVEEERALIKLVYSTNRSSDWTLKNILVQNAHVLIDEHEALAAEDLQKMLRDVPDYAVDIASTRLHRTQCPLDNEHEALWLERRCNCGRSKGCDNGECNKQRCDHSACSHCGRFGVIKFPIEGADANTI